MLCSRKTKEKTYTSCEVTTIIEVIHDENLYSPQMVERTKTNKNNNFKKYLKKDKCYYFKTVLT